MGDTPSPSGTSGWRTPGLHCSTSRSSCRVRGETVKFTSQLNFTAGVQPWSDPEERRRGPGDIYGLTFQNISMAAPSVLGEQEVIWGMEDGLVYGLVFDNVTIGEDTVEGVDYFYHNQYVQD